MRIFPLLFCNIRTALAPQGPYTRAITFVANDYHVTAAATAERTVIAILLMLLKKNIAMLLLLLKKNIAMLLLLLLLKER